MYFLKFMCDGLSKKINRKLPFFTYGFFRPGEISFLGIKDFVKCVIPLNITGDLVLRDGITLFKDSSDQRVNGYLITFESVHTNEAYSFIDSLEPEKLFRWEEKSTLEGERFNILIGIKPDRGSENIRETNWKTIWEDPFFTSAIELLEEIPNEAFDCNLKPLFKLQMKYMLLWTILERFSFLRYSLGGRPSANIGLLANDQYFKEALKIFAKKERYVYSSEDPGNKLTLNSDNPKKSVAYYYQVRCNITHRGKAVVRDHDTVKNSFDELFKITKYLLCKTKAECEKIKNKYETRRD